MEAWDWKEVVVLFVVVYSAALIGGKYIRIAMTVT